MKVWSSILTALNDLNVKQNISKNNLYLICLKSTEFKILGECKVDDILKKNTWIMRLLRSELKILGVTHHGLVTQDGGKEIINYDGEGFDCANATIRKTNLDKFVQNEQDNIFFVVNVNDQHKNSQEYIDKILNDRLGENKYDLISNNCEIFVRDTLIKNEYKNLYQHQAENFLNNIKAINNLDKITCYRYDRQNNKLNKLDFLS